MSKSFIKIAQTGSPIRRHHRQRETLIGLGLNRIGRVTHVPNTPQTRGMIAKVKHLVRIMQEPAVLEFISEDDLKTFEGWLKYQGYDPAMLEPDDLAKWRRVFDEIRERPDAKVGLMKLGARVPGDRIYAVAVRDSGLWLTLWVRRSWKSEFFVFMPRPDGSNPHASYHRDGRFHHKSENRTFSQKQLPRLDQPFKGTVNLSAWGGHGAKAVGAVCDPNVFAGVVELPPDVLGPRDGHVVVDLVEPGCDPITWPGELVQQEIFKDAEPWIVIRVVRQNLPGAA